MAEFGAVDTTDAVAEPVGPVSVATEESTPANGVGAATAATEPAGDAAPGDGEGAADRPKRGRPRKAAAKPKGIELVLTVSGSAEGTDWRAEVSHGTKRVVKDLAIPASAVAAAAKDLHPEVAEAIEEVLSAAREQQRSRVEQLQAELEAARRALADLED